MPPLIQQLPNTSRSPSPAPTDDSPSSPAPTFVISGGGIVGMVLALAIRKHLGIIPEIYEKAHGFAEDVGAGLGVYPNGLRVLRDIDPELVQAIRDAGCPYLYRIWEKQDGTPIATAKEDVLAGGEQDLMSVGIKRWKLQDVLYAAIEKEGIPLHFNKATTDIVEQEDGRVELQFADGTTRMADILFCAEGAHSKVRHCVDPNIQLKYTGVTCLMGIAKCPIPQQGIHFPSSETSHFHAVYFPVNKTEQCFQIHFPVKEEDSDKRDWGNLTKADGVVEFDRIANEMIKDGWAKEFTDPLFQVDHAVRVGFALMQPRMDKWVFGTKRRIVLLGDACHPPVPYVGQGAQMGIEDAGTLVLLMKKMCLDEDNKTFHWSRFSKATALYEKVRIPRTSTVLDCSKSLGERQVLRSQEVYSEMAELMIQGEVMINDTLAEMLPGATFDYAAEVEYVLHREEKKKLRLHQSSSFDVDKINSAMEALWGGVNPFGDHTCHTKVRLDARHQ